MKFLLAFLFATAAHAEFVTINYPSFQGKPILAQGRGETSSETEVRAHMVCRMAGYAKAKAVDERYSSRIQAGVGALVAEMDYFIPESISADAWGLNGETWVRLSHPDLPVRSGGIASQRKPVFKRHKKIHDCATAAQCRGFDIQQFLVQRASAFEYGHPFVAACYKWANSSSEPFVFTQVTCETKPSFQAVEQDMKAFHAATNNRFKVTSSEPHQMGLRLSNPSKSCAAYASRALEGSISSARPFTCDHQPFHPLAVRLGINLFDPTFMNFIYLTNRYRTGPHPGPADVQNIIKTYARSVVPTEYEMTDAQLSAMELPFCVESTSAVEVSQSQKETNCSFLVHTRDFLQAKNTLTISLGIENGEDKNVARCETLHRSFNHASISCAQANFCPAPGTIIRSRP